MLNALAMRKAPSDSAARHCFASSSFNREHAHLAVALWTFLQGGPGGEGAAEQPLGQQWLEGLTAKLAECVTEATETVTVTRSAGPPRPFPPRSLLSTRSAADLPFAGTW